RIQQDRLGFDNDALCRHCVRPPSFNLPNWHSQSLVAALHELTLSSSSPITLRPKVLRISNTRGRSSLVFQDRDKGGFLQQTWPPWPRSDKDQVSCLLKIRQAKKPATALSSLMIYSVPVRRRKRLSRVSYRRTPSSDSSRPRNPASRCSPCILPVAFPRCAISSI